MLRFRSSEKIWLKGGKNFDDPDSIQGLIEIALLKLRPLVYPRVYLSSRIAVLKKDVFLPENGNFSSYIPIEEWKRCYFLKLPDFNIDKFEKAATYFPGYHDFSSFKRFDSFNVHKTNRRLLYSVKVQPGQPLVTSYSNSNIQHFFDYWDVEFHGKGFVHKQIRRMLGAMISAAIGKLPVEEIKVMLQVPSKHSWPSYLQSAPPHGLYLCNVEYNPEHLVFDSNINSKKSEEILNEIEEECE
ncbi:tRNA pseudouridine synthase-like 1 [Eumeta japonica]|uniref:tRNA pseudouridine synthase n=1 Tax=Eumeta variegata TaxID=151549 RepID=A0A4C1YW97_EUMVA|nr:tRNA pseudouridine synthase-like 1 [Eumeta japonica]